VKHATLGLLAFFVIGCGGHGAPGPASYCGDMPDSGNFDIYGRCVLTIATDNQVLGTIDGGGRRFEIRGEMQDNGYFSGVLDGPSDYNVSGTLLSDGDEEVRVSWTIGSRAEDDDSVSFILGRC
jgi:hypothetical protein